MPTKENIKDWFSRCGRWVVTRRRLYRSAVTVAVIVVLAGGSSGCDLKGLAGTELAAVARNIGQRPWVVHHSGRDARYQQHSAQLSGACR